MLKNTAFIISGKFCWIEGLLFAQQKCEYFVVLPGLVQD